MKLSETNPFSEAKKYNKPLILDGAMGSLLQQRGYLLDDKIWATNINQAHPEEVLSIHKEYIDAGADIITTNTFRTNPLAFEGSEYNFDATYVRNAVQITKSSVGDLPLLVAGSNAPAEDCYKKERTTSYEKLKLNHTNHIDLLIDNSVNFILNETQSHFDEISFICEYCCESKIPFIISLFIDENMKILSGERIIDIIQHIQNYAPLAIGFNCILPSVFIRILPLIPSNINWGFYLNCGSGNYSDRFIQCGVSPSEYLKTVRESLKYEPSFIGSCCGSNPDHIKAIKMLYEQT